MHRVVGLVAISMFFLWLPVLAQQEPLDQLSTFENEQYLDQDSIEVQQESELEEDESEDYSSYNFTLEEGDELPRSQRSQEYLQEIELVLAGADFAQKETVERWRWKDLDYWNDETNQAERDEKFPTWMIDFFETLENNKTTLASFSLFLEISLWSLVALAILLIIVRYRQQLSSFITNLGNETVEPDLPTTLFGLDIKKESIPRDVVATAKQFWAETQAREAIAALLRASLIKLLHEHKCQFYDSDTEAECCQRIDQQAPQKVSVYMRKLVDVWQRVAYAHISPSQQEFEQLCQQWTEVF